MNNFEFKGKLTLVKRYKNVEMQCIDILLETVVPLGYSYICNDELNNGIVCFNKNIHEDESVDTLLEQIKEEFLKNKKVSNFEMMTMELYPVVKKDYPYIGEFSYVDKTIHLHE